ncbi:PREDICTED: piggyBac transposable element-derived protein 4-like [Eufriesea mexicana]|uniref:piggyBac transposable element-derived protein 4-like n=1 Tax=Eufriesea mexicana TaxID=516756 RepID=UPI00083BCCEE|nr:PREDICTED: piggyBac transposable element-derived protein 4-like [Eufriesea mexicana]XP_017762901.1 PREDICTED: piggyBac transposable element-derived protein 4-like [Eufriesea mexicana]
MKLIGDLLFKGRTLFTDSFYTSVPLAEDLLTKRTYICGTIKMNRKFLPPQAKQKQKRGDIISLENRSGVKFLKWTDKRPLCMLTTSRSQNCALIRGKNDKLKPDAVFSYNSAKKGVDLSDQMCSYYKCLRKTVKWYRKVVMELICGTSLVNAWYIHNNVENPPNDEVIVSRRKKHFLSTYQGPARKMRKRCKECYKRLTNLKGTRYATNKTKRIMTFCNSCPDKPPLCLKCFKKLHR